MARRPGLDWDARHGVWSGVLNGAGTAVATAAVGSQAGLPPSWALAAGGAGAVGAVVAGAVRRTLSKASLVYRAACWLAAGGWTAYALQHGVWDGETLGALLAGTVAAGTLGGDLAHHEREVTEKRTGQLLASERTKVAREWEDRLERVGGARLKGVRIIAVERWESGAGQTLEGEVPPGGATWKDVAALCDGLAADAKLPEGCSVEAAPGVHRAAFLLKISTINHLVEDAPYPEDYSELSINGPLPLGPHSDGQTAGPVMRELSAAVAAQKGAGKTNLLNVMIAGFNRMPDALVWVIDLNAGGLAQKWMRAWYAAGRPGRPPIDWIAGDKHEALKMARAALAVALARKSGYQDREIEADDDKLPVGPDVPAIELALDEGAEIIGQRAGFDPVLREIRDTLVRIMELGRAAAVNVIGCYLRVTQDVVSEPQMIKQAGLRLGLRVADQNEIAYLFGWDARITPEDIPWEGCGAIRVHSQPIQKLKVYRIVPSQIADVVKATARLRPQLDGLSEQAAGPDYATRWQRTAALFGEQPEPTDSTPEPTAATDVTAGWDQLTGDANDIAEQARRNLHRAVAEREGRDPDLAEQFARVLGQATPEPDWREGATPEQSARPVDARRERARAIVRDAGPSGIKARVIVDQLAADFPTNPPNRSTVQEWLAADLRDGLMHQPDGRRGYYAHGPAAEGDQ